MKIGLVAIFKNEYPYILEWISYHKNVGVDKFYIADNIIDDGSTELLEALDELGVIKRIPYPRINGRPPQAPAYNYILKEYGNEVDILGFIDADEFIVSENGLKKDLHDFYHNDNFGAMGLNWKVYGSNNDFFSTSGLVIERFTSHGNMKFDNNRHIKTFLKPHYVDKMNIHECVLKEREYCTSSNEKMEFDDSKARTLEINHDKMYINHYVVKSRVEHFINKRRKGSAAGSANREKGITYFKVHDQNAETSHFNLSFINKVKTDIEDLKTELISRTSFMQLGRGHVDVNAAKNIIIGWACLENNTPPKYIKILIDEQEYKVELNKEREDVLKKGLSDNILCGFKLVLDIDLIGKVVKGYVYGSIQELRVSYL